MEQSAGGRRICRRRAAQSRPYDRQVREPRKLPPNERTLSALLERAAEREPGRVLARDERSSLTCAEALEAAARRAATLADAGVGRGDRVAVLSENRLEVVELWLACAWRGAVLILLNTALRGPQLEHVFADAEPTLLVLEPEFVERLDYVGNAPEQRWIFGQNLPAPSNAIEQTPVGPGDASVILYTSGTTGPSKGVLCPHAQWYWWGVRTGDILGVVAGDVLYTNLPLFHTNALNTFVQALVFDATFFRRSEVFGVAVLASARRCRRHGHVPARDDGARPGEARSGPR